MELEKTYILQNGDSIALLPVGYAYKFHNDSHQPSDEVEATLAM